MVKADLIVEVGKVAFVDIACQPRRLSASYPTLLLSRSSVPFRDGNYGRTSASERIKFIISANTRGWLSQFRHEKQQEGKGEKKKEKRPTFQKK